jgi:predicted acylesterase/phospholipase RssA
MLVDGGVVHNLPIGTMAAAAEGPTIAVDVTNRFDPGLRATRNGATSNANLPRIGETLVRTLLLGSADTAEALERAGLVVAA